MRSTEYHLNYLQQHVEPMDPSASKDVLAPIESAVATELHEYWEENMMHADWYARLEPFLGTWVWPLVHDDRRVGVVRRPFYRLVGRMLDEDRVPLAETGPDFDRARTELRERLLGQTLLQYVVIHHSEGEPVHDSESGFDAVAERQKLNAVPFVRVYAPLFAEDRALRGTAMWSGHFDEHGKQVFFAYNGAIGPDGQVIWLLKDPRRKYTLWHAGGNANTRSGSIVLVGNYEHATPPLAQIQGAASAIRENYAELPFDGEHIKGHCEVSSPGAPRTCPGEYFLPSVNGNGWKSLLLAELQ